MASEQARRENTTSEREIPVEKDRVPKMTSHFESLAEQARESPPQEGAEDRERHDEQGSRFESLSDKVKNGKDIEAEAREGREKRSYAVGKFEVNGAGEAKCREAGHEKQGGEAMEVGRKEESRQERGGGGGAEMRSKEEGRDRQKGGERKEVRSKEEVLLNLWFISELLVDGG
jgi:hypothetical protein